MSFAITARGHPSILSTHPTTLEVTTERHLTTNGDCIVAVESSAGLSDLPAPLKRILSDDLGRGVLTIQVRDRTFTVHGRGSSSLSLTHPREIVVRKSRFISDRTLMILSDKSSIDIPREMVKLLQNPREEVNVKIFATLQAPTSHPLPPATS